MRQSARAVIAIAAIGVVGCSGAPEPVANPPVARATPPPAPTVVRESALPIVAIRVAFLVGKSADGEKPGLVATTASLMEEGGAGPHSGKELANRVESLGSFLGISTTADRTVFSMTVTKDGLWKASELLGTIVQSPRFSAIAFDKLKKRELDGAADSARSSGSWAASMVLYRDLFALPTDHHPYASFAPSPADVARLTSSDCRATHRKWFIPKNAFVVVAGDTSPDEVRTVVAKAFGGFSGGEVPTISYPEVQAPDHRRITLVDRPKASQSDVYVASLGLERGDKQWTSFAVTNKILGGGVGGRLFKDVRDKQALAYVASSQITELGHARAPLVSYVGTQTAKTGVALDAVLKELDRLATTAPDDAEVEAARRFMKDMFAIRFETVGAVADEIVRKHSLGLTDDYDDVFRRELAEVTPALVTKLAGETFRSGHEIVVVAGDANAVGPMLRHFGEVKVLDPTKEFARVTTLPMDASAPLEIPGDGK
jgi:zinc protease